MVMTVQAQRMIKASKLGIHDDDRNEYFDRLRSAPVFLPEILFTAIFRTISFRPITAKEAS